MRPMASGLANSGRKARLTVRIKSVGDDDADNGQGHLPWPYPRQRSRAEHASRSDQHQKFFLGCVPVSPFTQGRHGEHDDGVGKAQGTGPGQGGPFGFVGHCTHEVSGKHRRNDHGGVTRVGKVVHGPAKDFSAFDTRIQHGNGACAW
jgi:hypothetical protein